MNQVRFYWNRNFFVPTKISPKTDKFILFQMLLQSQIVMSQINPKILIILKCLIQMVKIARRWRNSAVAVVSPSFLRVPYCSSCLWLLNIKGKPKIGCYTKVLKTTVSAILFVYSKEKGLTIYSLSKVQLSREGELNHPPVQWSVRTLGIDRHPISVK